MSRLHYSENGRVVPSLCEELTRFRRARKVLRLPATSRDATLYVLARAYEETKLPLRVMVNGTELSSIAPQPWVFYRWFEIDLPTTLLKAAENVFEFWTDATAMNAWSLAIESGHVNPQSYLSDDGGASWRNEHMGYLHVLQGEYVARVRLAEGDDPPPPPIEWEDPACPRFESLRCRLPPQAFEQSLSTLDRTRAVCTWVATSWKHNGTALGGVQYAPWDAETILEWGKTLAGHNGRNPVVNCVHYAVVFCAAAQAGGIPARCVPVQGDPLGLGGHFINEVWLVDLNKWAMVDANLDAMFFDDDVPMSISEIQQAGPELNRFVKWGPGTQMRMSEWKLGDDFEQKNPFDKYLNGVTFRHRAVWRRADFLTRPDLTPPGHGTLCGCETDMIWARRDQQRGFAMFPFFADADYFDAPPRSPEPTAHSAQRHGRTEDAVTS
jgi:hypothetical protein